MGELGRDELIHQHKAGHTVERGGLKASDEAEWGVQQDLHEVVRTGDQLKPVPRRQVMRRIPRSSCNREQQKGWNKPTEIDTLPIPSPTILDSWYIKVTGT